MPTKLTFTIDDSGATNFADCLVPVVVRRACAELNKLPDGKLLTRRTLCAMLKVSEGHGTNYFRNPALEDYRELHVRKILYANPKTIKQFRAQKSQS